MRVLVTGATGFVGRHVVRALLAAGHSVMALVRDPERVRTFDWFKQVHVVCHDLRSANRVVLAVSELPDAVMHLAWSGLPNYGSLFHIEENLPTDYRFIKSLINQGVDQVLVTGTCFEYGMQSGCLAETSSCGPINSYALAKDSLHKFLRNLQREQFFVLQWARLFYMYGEGQNPNSLFAQLDLEIERGAKTFNMSGGEQLRDYLPVEEVARRLVGLVHQKDADGIYNVCSGRPISIRRLVEEHLNHRGAQMNLNLGCYPYPDYEPMAFWGDSRKLDLLLE